MKPQPPKSSRKRPKVKAGAELAALVKLPDSAFTNANCAETNRVFLYDARSAGGVKPVLGWIIVGYGQAPWPGSTDGFAVMFEKTTPAEEKDNMFAPEHVRFEEGTRIWQHYSKRWLPATPKP